MAADTSVALPTLPLTLICRRLSSGPRGAPVEHNPLHPDIVVQGSVSDPASGVEGKQSVRDRVAGGFEKGVEKSS